MTTSHFAKSRQVQRQLLTLLASTTLLTAGCSNLAGTASSSDSSAQIVKVGGRIHGGNQPVSGATVTLWFAGQGPSFGSTATLAAQTTSANDGFGSFSFIRGADGGTSNGASGNTFSCPVTPPNSPLAMNGGPNVFVVARGGNTVNDGSANVNNDAVFIAPFGRCGGISGSTFVSMSEVVTAATVAAIHQYMNPGISPIESSIGSDGIYISDTALAHSFATVSSLVNLATGQSLGTTTLSGATNSTTGIANATVTVTPEQAKLNHVGNILSSCINNASSGSSACTSLYSDAVAPADLTTTDLPAGGTAPAATDVLQAAYYIFTNPTGNVQALYGLSPATGAPYQPQLTTQPSDWTVAIDYTSTSLCGDVATPTASYINRVSSLAIDLNGNVYFANAQGGGSLGAISATGSPLSCYTLPTGTFNIPTGPGARATLVDTSGNVWIGSARSNDIYRYTPGTGTVLTTVTDSPVLALTTDGHGDVFYSSTGGIYEIPNGATATALTPAIVPINTQAVGTALHLTVDTNNTIWATSEGSNITATTSTLNAGATSLGAPFVTTSFATPGATTGISATSRAGIPGTGVYVSSSNSLSFVLSAGTAGTPFSGGGLNAPYDIAVDGSQNVWATNTNNGGLSEFSKGGTPLSPNPAGFAKQFDNNQISGQISIIIDASGDVWSGQSQSTNTIQELIGAAVPTYQPYAQGLPPNDGTRFQTVP